LAAKDSSAAADTDLASISNARALARVAKEARPLLAELSQERIDAIVTAMATAVTPHAIIVRREMILLMTTPLRVRR